MSDDGAETSCHRIQQAESVLTTRFVHYTQGVEPIQTASPLVSVTSHDTTSVSSTTGMSCMRQIKKKIMCDVYMDHVFSFMSRCTGTVIHNNVRDWLFLGFKASGVNSIEAEVWDDR